MNPNENSGHTSFSEILELKDNDLHKVTGGSVDSDLTKKAEKHGGLMDREVVKTGTDHYGFLWLKKREKQKVKLKYEDNHVEYLTETRSLR